MQADRLPPHDIQAEESVVGSLLIDGESITNISGFLKPDDFYRERNRWCYEACLELLNRSEAINQVTVAHELDTMNVLEEVGGSSYLNQVVAVVPTSVHIEYYGRIVHRTATMRRLITVARRHRGDRVPGRSGRRQLAGRSRRPVVRHSFRSPHA